MAEEGKKTVEMKRARVPRNRVEEKMASGWVPLKGTGADGFLWESGDLVMEMPMTKYNELCKRRSEPSRHLQESLRRGLPMAPVPEGMTATASVETQKKQS